MICNIFVILLLFHHVVSFHPFAPLKKEVNTMAYQDCPSLPSTVVIRNNLTISATGKGKTSVNGVITVSEDVVLDSLVLKLYSCGERNTIHLEDCEFFFKVVKDNPCVLHEDKSQFWATVISSISPSILCVNGKILKNTYTMTNGTFQVAKRNRLNLPDNHWAMQIEYLNEKKEVIECLFIQLEVFTSRQL